MRLIRKENLRRIAASSMNRNISPEFTVVRAGHEIAVGVFYIPGGYL